jgi:WD40 repeat protein
VAFSPDGTRLATAESWEGARLYAVESREVARVWDAATGRQLLKLEVPDGRAVAFSPDGTRLATVGHGSPRIWDAASGNQLPKVRHGSAQAVAFSPDGTRLATGGSDGSVRVWRVAR